VSTGKTAGEEDRAAVADSLPPTQYLVLEVLAARARLGEACWTFPTRLLPALNALQALGLIWWRHAPIPACVQAYLTDAGREAVLSPGYEPPVTGIAGETEWGVRRQDCADGVFSVGGDEELARLIIEQERYGISGALLRRTVTPWEVVP
jgi:hypothetical protein